MTKAERNKRWAELEGWKKGEFYIPLSNMSKKNVRYPWKDGNGEGRNSLPDWTEPNRFFSEVVPRIRGISELKYGEKLELAFEYSGAIVHCSFTNMWWRWNWLIENWREKDAKGS